MIITQSQEKLSLCTADLLRLNTIPEHISTVRDNLGCFRLFIQVTDTLSTVDDEDRRWIFYLFEPLEHFLE